MAVPAKNVLSQGSVRTAHLLWQSLEDITAVGATHGVTARKWSDLSQYFPPNAVSSTYPYYNVSPYLNTFEVRFQTTAAADAQVVEMWGARGEDHFTLLATLTLTGGTQSGDTDKTFVFVDVIVATNEGLPKAGTVIDGAAGSNNRIARYVVDLAGYSKLLFNAITYVASSNLRVQATGY